MNDIDLVISTQNGIVIPAIQEGITWETERKDVPGKLTFKCLFDKASQFEEGDSVKVNYKGSPVFYGFVFSMSRDKNQIISVTAYDQLRYLKNKHVFEYRNKKASEVITLLAKDFLLNLGEIEDTEFIIPKRLEDNVTLFDIIQTALGITLQNTKKMFVLYDDFGKLTLKNIESMKTNYFINNEVSENFSYKSSIENSANVILLYKESSSEGKRLVGHKIDNDSVERWGRLQLVDTVKEEENVDMKVAALLELYNRKFKTLIIKNVFGNVKIRAGTSIVVQLDLGDIQINSYMLVEKAKHIFKKDEYFMDLTVRGADIV